MPQHAGGRTLTCDKDMSGRCPAPCGAEQIDKSVASLIGTGGWARLVGIAGAVHLAGSYSRNADARPFRAPNRPISVIDMGWGTLEALAFGYDKD